MNEKKQVSIFWFRRDLRYTDNKGFYHALVENDNVLPIFIFDRKILGKIDNSSDPRVMFIYQQLEELEIKFRQAGSSLLVLDGYVNEIFEYVLDEYEVLSVYANKDYEPDSIKRDNYVKELLSTFDITLKLYKDQVVFEEKEIVKKDGSVYNVFSPYSKTWKENLSAEQTKYYNSENYLNNLFKTNFDFPSLESFGFKYNDFKYPSKEIDKRKIITYDHNRDFPSADGTTRLGIHLRFGTISIRELTKLALGTNDIFLDELIWREFYMMILCNYPYVEHSAFKQLYGNFHWENNEEGFVKWCEGKTGYPFVDAGMRELNQTGFMHNRLRMVAASFLTKHLLTDWRWGEAYFASKLLDYELASNNGGWQWAAGTGCDAAPYFRLFNPYIQAKRYDPHNEYIKKWVPEFNTSDYPRPIVEHSHARAKAIEVHKRFYAESK